MSDGGEREREPTERAQRGEMHELGEDLVSVVSVGACCVSSVRVM